MAEQIKAEREALFAKPVPAKHRASSKMAKEEYKDVKAAYFAERAKNFADKYGHPKSFSLHLDKTFEEICKLLDVKTKDVLGRSRKSKLVFARKMFGFFAYYYFGLVQQQVADYVRKERSTMATHVHDFVTDLTIYSAVREKAKHIDSFLYKILEQQNEI
jgi:chromosomal replication initiation ATPase DnaA